MPFCAFRSLDTKPVPVGKLLYCVRKINRVKVKPVFGVGDII